MDVQTVLSSPSTDADPDRTDRATHLIALALSRWLTAVDDAPDVRVYADYPEEVRR